MRPTIDPKSVASHPLLPFAYSQQVGHGTGFIVQASGINVLITNYHVVSGRHPLTHRLLDGLVAQPDRILVPLLRRGAGLVWMPAVQPLYDVAGEALWTVHPRFGSRFDVVALPISVPPEAEVVPYAIEPGPDIALVPGSEVAIVGFPEGMTASGITAIWKSGSIASEIELTIEGEDYFWIDSNTRRGMSGSPVIARRFGGAMMTNGVFAVGGLVDRLLGVYSGRALDAPDATLGKVWHWSSVRPIIDEAVAKVLRGVWTPQRTQIGHIPRAHQMVRLDANRSVDVTVMDQTGVARTRTISVGELLLEFALADERFGVNLERVKMAATVAAAITAARAGNGNLNLEDTQYALIRDIVQAPLKPYNPVIARQAVDLLDHIVGAGQAVVAAPPA